MKRQFPDLAILYIDDEEKSLKYFSAIFDPIAPILTASSPEQGFRIFAENSDSIALVLSDKKMPNESGLDLLRRIEQHDSRPFRILVTAFADLSVAVDALNQGLLYSYLTKPWDPVELEHTLVKALTHFQAIRERERLVREKSEAVDQLVMADRASSIGILSTGLNHHLRNSLTVLRTFFDMLPIQLHEELGREPTDAEFWTDYYGEVGVQMERMTSMLARLAEGASTGPVGDWEKIDLVALLQSAVQVSTLPAERILSLPRPDERFHIGGDVSRIGQMMRMLLHESTTAAGTDGNVEVSARRDGDSVVLEFINDGPALSEKDIEHRFDPFYVRSDAPEELGVNLLACYLTAFHHGGSIRAERSRDGRNAIVVVLPIEPPAIPVDELARKARRVFREPAPATTKSCETVLPA